ncbi:hypothetical protein BD410DRAFT_852457 [Rickenella mellea]|uniref:Survival Motor Neuron Gemin2-binding domain-containing protein n=1 Tax=Rickenella mellea TaxID=50990 RepID=A0A4Y7PKS8_9AGAM|nr:hypothetical protein BD410DRAFT_852457 [Rickenella mellea]
MRQLVPYDDLQPPTKKPRVCTQRDRTGQHRDDRGENTEQLTYGDNDHDPEKQDLTHAEIWDDSALIDAWNSANEEYEAFHGKSKSWKKEGIKKSPLWYSIPSDLISCPEQSPLNGSSIVIRDTSDTSDDPDSKPHDFNTFVPTHDPTLSAASDAHASPLKSPNYFSEHVPDVSTISADEAFSKALSAMYWGGYWTAMYHTARRSEISSDSAANDEGDADEEEEDLVVTQR